MINVWDTRTVFPKESIEKMSSVLVTPKANHKGIQIPNYISINDRFEYLSIKIKEKELSRISNQMI